MWVDQKSVGLLKQKAGLASRRVLFTRPRGSFLNVSGDREDLGCLAISLRVLDRLSIVGFDTSTLPHTLHLP
jgi:hypothetical protein